MPWAAGTAQLVHTTALLPLLGGLARDYHSRPAAAVAGWLTRLRCEQVNLVPAAQLAAFLNVLYGRMPDRVSEINEVGRLAGLYHYSDSLPADEPGYCQGYGVCVTCRSLCTTAGRQPDCYTGQPVPAAAPDPYRVRVAYAGGW